MSTDAASSPQAALQVDPATLPDDAALLKSLVAQLFAELQSRDGRISDLEHRMSLLLRKLYGSKSEKLDPRQTSLFDLLTAAAEDQTAVAATGPTGCRWRQLLRRDACRDIHNETATWPRPAAATRSTPAARGGA